MRHPTIVVATEGGPAGEASVRWAAHEAERRHVRLTVVHVLDWEWDTAHYDLDGLRFDLARELAESITASAAAAARVAAPSVDVRAVTLVGNPAARLLTIAGEAELLVVGGRGRGGFAGLLLGSVSQRVATHAPCPVVVVRGRPDRADGPVVVGFDDSEAATHVLATAFDAAAARGAGLLVVRSYLPPLPHYYAAVLATPEQEAAERARLTEQLAPWREKYPDVAVEIRLSHDGPAGVLADASHGAQLVVVGSRGHGVIVGTLLGSTGLQLLHHADCPVYLDRPGRVWRS
jgi:nucleotide-binding universal stress UspA family protein